MTLPKPLGSVPKYEILNLLVETLHLIYYMTTFKKLYFFHVMTLPHTLGRPQNMKSETYSLRPFI